MPQTIVKHTVAVARNPNYKMRGLSLFDTQVAQSGKFLELARVGRVGQRLQDMINNELFFSERAKMVYGQCDELLEPYIVKQEYAAGKDTTQLQKAYDRLVASLAGRPANNLPDYMLLHYDYLLPKVGSTSVAEYEETRGRLVHVLINKTFEYISTSLIDPDLYSTKRVTLFIFVEEDTYKNDQTLQLLEKKPADYMARMIKVKAARLVRLRHDNNQIMVTLEEAQGEAARDIPEYKQAERELKKIAYQTKAFATFMKLSEERNIVEEFFDINVLRIPNHSISVDLKLLSDKLKALYQERVSERLPMGI